MSSALSRATTQEGLASSALGPSVPRHLPVLQKQVKFVVSSQTDAGPQGPRLPFPLWVPGRSCREEGCHYHQGSKKIANNQGEVGLVSRLFLMIIFKKRVMCAANREEACEVQHSRCGRLGDSVIGAVTAGVGGSPPYFGFRPVNPRGLRVLPRECSSCMHRGSLAFAWGARHQVERELSR